MNPYLLIFSAAMLWALVGIFTALLLAAGMGALEIAFWRAAIAASAFTIHSLVTGQYLLRRRSDLAVFIAFGLVGVTLFFSSLSLAVDTGGISLAVVLLYTAPVFVIILARVFLGESLTAAKASAVALVVGGVALIAFGGDSTGISITAVSLGWGLCAGLSYALLSVGGKYLLTNYNPVTIYAYIMPVGALGLAPIVELSLPSTTAFLWLLPLGILSTYASSLLYYTGLHRAQASRAVLVASTEPVIAAVLAAIFFGERFGFLGALGAAMVVLASLIGVFWRSGKIPTDRSAGANRSAGASNGGA